MPATDKLTFTTPTAATFAPETEVMVVTVAERTRAYPVAAVLRREVLNDVFADQPLVVVFCESCNVGMSYSSRAADQVLSFVPAGMRDGAEMMKDTQTDTIWTQLSGSALEGSLEGQSLEMYALETMTFGDYRERYPEGEILSE